MTKKMITLLLLLLPLILITACQQQTPVSSEQKANVKSSEVTMIQSDSSSDISTELQEQDDEKKVCTLEDSAIANGRVVNEQRNILLLEDGRLYYAKLSEETNEPVFCLIAEHVKQMGTQPGIDENTSPEFQTEDGKFWTYKGDGTNLQPELLLDHQAYKDYKLKGQGVLEDCEELSEPAPWSILYSAFQTESSKNLLNLRYFSKDAIECNYQDKEIYYIYHSAINTLEYEKINASKTRPLSPELICTDITKFQANYYKKDSPILQVCYLSDEKFLYIINDLNKVVKLSDINFYSKEKENVVYSDVRDFWRGPKDSIVFQKTNGSVLMYSPNRELQKFLNIDPSTKIKELMYFPSEKGLDDYKYAYIDMDGKLHYSSDVHLLNSAYKTYNSINRQTQNQTFSDEDFKEAQKQAELLSYDLIESFSAPSVLANEKTAEKMNFELLDIENFIYLVASSNINQNTEYMYSSYFIKNEKDIYIFPLKKS